MKKGPLAEALVVRFLQEHGWPLTERRVMGGARDRGDVAGIPGLVVEVKNQQRMALSEWLNEVDAEARNFREARADRTDLPVVWHKRRGKGSPGDWYVTMDGWAFIELLTAWTERT